MRDKLFLTPTQLLGYRVPTLRTPGTGVGLLVLWLLFWELKGDPSVLLPDPGQGLVGWNIPLF